MSDKVLYAITNRKNGIDFISLIELALKGGVQILQFREKNLSARDFDYLGNKIHDLTQKYHVPLIIDDNVEGALRIGAEGVHVGPGDVPVSFIKKNHPSLIVGATAKSVHAARRAEEDGADYLGVGAIFPSQTKQNAVPITVDTLNEICASVHIPVFAIGGIDANNLDILKGSDIRGIAVCSAIFSREDADVAAREIKQKMEMVL